MHTPGIIAVNGGELTTPQEAGRSYRRIACVADYGAGRNTTDNANARRLAACWNACLGISTDELEKGCIGGLLRATQIAYSCLRSPDTERDKNKVTNILLTAIAKAESR